MSYVEPIEKVEDNVDICKKWHDFLRIRWIETIQRKLRYSELGPKEYGDCRVYEHQSCNKQQPNPRPGLGDFLGSKCNAFQQYIKYSRRKLTGRDMSL